MALRLNEAEVRALLNPLELIDAMEAALISFSSGESVQPVRTVFGLNDKSLFGVMPAFVRSPSVHGAKMLTVIPSNTSKGLPTHLATIILLNPDTGGLLALVDGRSVTELRTAAVSAVSMRYLSGPAAAVMAILGSGVQARSHLAALSLTREFQEVRVWSPTSSHLERFVADADRPVRATSTAEEAVRGADVIVLATSSPTPVIESAWVKDGAHVICLGACIPSQREMDPALVARAFLIVDSKAASLKESGDIVQGLREGYFTEDHIRAELGEVASRKSAGHSNRDVTVFKSLGMAVEDLVAAHMAYRAACEKGKGFNIPD
jgi:alanine dehydrogenase